MLDGVGFAAWMSPDPFYDPYCGRYREFIRVHPTPNGGTEGCIGLHGTAAELKRVRCLIGYNLFKRNSMPVSVKIGGL